MPLFVTLGVILAVVLIGFAVASSGLYTNNSSPPKTVLEQSGSGSASTEKFTVSHSDWDLAWSYNCSNAFGVPGNFIVITYQGDGGLDGGDSVNQLGTSGSNTDHFHDGPGTYYFQINSECNWQVTVTG